MQFLLYLAFIVAAFVGDRLVKNWAAGPLQLQMNGSMPLIQDVFHFTYCENRGAAFSMLEGKKWLLIGMTALICLCVIYFIFFSKKHLPLFPGICLALALGGALGNLYDRVVLGYVIDMLDFCLIHFAIFNVADSCVCVGVIGFGVWYIFFEEKDRSLKTLKKQASDNKEL